MQTYGDTEDVTVTQDAGSMTISQTAESASMVGNKGTAGKIISEVIEVVKGWRELAMGVGSIVDPATAALYLQLGACFVLTVLRLFRTMLLKS